METTKRRSTTLKILSLCLTFWVIFLGAHIAEATVVFARTTITIHPVILPEDSSKMRLAEHKPRIVATGPLKIQAEIRPAKSFQMPSLYLTKPLTGNDTYLIPLPVLPRPKDIDSPSPRHKIKPANVYAPIDILAIDQQGTILQIWPKLNLSTLSADILLPEASHAVLYMASGRAAELGITPHARVEHDFFTPPPNSLK